MRDYGHIEQRHTAYQHGAQHDIAWRDFGQGPRVYEGRRDLDLDNPAALPERDRSDRDESGWSQVLTVLSVILHLIRILSLFRR